MDLVGDSDGATDLESEERDLSDLQADFSESDGDGRFLSEEDLCKKLSQYDPDRMKLTEEEYGNAMDIKYVVENMPELDNLCDFMYAQLAIICKDDVEDAIRRCYGMQEFRREYQILHNYEQGCQVVRNNIRLFPLHFLHFSFSEREGTYIFVYDLAQFEPKKFTSAAMVDEWMICAYYTHVLFCPDLESVRKGTLVMIECEGMNLRRDIHKHFSAFFSQFLTHYPFDGQARHYHTSAMVNVIASLLRPMLPKELRKKMVVGLQFEGHMGESFLVPTVEAANGKMFAEMAKALKQRHENENTFVLN